MPKMKTAELTQVKAGLCNENARIRALANFSRTGHNVTSTGAFFVCTGCRMRRKERTNSDWTKIECLRLTNTRDVWTQEVLAEQGAWTDDPTERALRVHPLEAGPQGRVELEDREKLGPVCEVTDYAAGSKRRKQEVKMKSKLVTQDDNKVMEIANLEAT